MLINMSEDKEDRSVLFSEIRLNSSKRKQCIKYGKEVIWKADRFSWNIFAVIKDLLYEVFLPRGYPDSVSDDYAWYQVWDTLQACCSTFSNMLAVQSVLLGVGVGRDNATSLSAAMAWFTKDGVGMISGIGFAWFKGTNLDSECKKWRLFADAINDAALCLELSISMLLDIATPILCLSSALKAVVGVAGGATRAALTHHQAARGNTADVAAKDGSQETLVNLAAISTGIWLINTTTIQQNVWFVMGFLVVLHLYCNFRAVKSLRLRKMNEERYLITLQSYLYTGIVPSVAVVNKQESVILGLGHTATKLCGFSIAIGESLKGRVSNVVELTSLLLTFGSSGKEYLLVPEIERQRLSIAFPPNLTDRIILKAYFHAVLLGYLLNKRESAVPPHTLLSKLISKSNVFQSRPEDALQAAVSCCESLVEEEFAIFADACEKEGWNVNEHVIRGDQWRIEWEKNERRTD